MAIESLAPEMQTLTLSSTVGGPGGINEIGEDIFHLILFELAKYYPSFRDKERCAYFLGLTVVCRTWRAMILPFVYSKLFIELGVIRVTSSVRTVLAAGHSVYPRQLKLVIGHNVNDSNLIDMLDQVGFGDTTWPSITKLDVIFDAGIGYIAAQYRTQGNVAALEQVVDYLTSQMPAIKEIEVCHARFSEFRGINDDNDFLLVPKLVESYSGQLHKVAMELVGYAIQVPWLPQQITHLSIFMINHDSYLVPKIFAPSLQVLNIIHTIDFTWNWFGSGSGDEVWFNCLKKLSIEYSGLNRSGIRDSDRDGSLLSASNEMTKKVYFPVLQSLKVRRYPFIDGGFYKVFENCQLKQLVTCSPRRAHVHIPSKLLASPIDVDIKINYNHAQFEANTQGIPPAISREAAYNNGVAKVLSSPSNAQYARIEVLTADTITIPDTLAWNSVRRLALDAFISIPSLHVILARMPLLKHLAFYMKSSHWDKMRDEGISVDGGSSQQTTVTNKSVECMTLRFDTFNDSPMSSLQFCLTRILPLVPSLLKLKVNQELVEDYEKIVFDQAGALRHLSGQLEIAKGE